MSNVINVEKENKMKKQIKACLDMIVTILKHKLALYKASKLIGGIPIMRVLLHDISKLSINEFWPYVKRFNLGVKDDSFDRAWEHHWKNNDHHLEYWEEKNLTFSGKSIDNAFCGDRKQDRSYPVFYMPPVCIREMIADWIAASIVYSGEVPKAPNWAWGNENLVYKLKNLETQQLSNICSRSYAVRLLADLDMITEEQVKEVLILGSHNGNTNDKNRND